MAKLEGLSAEPRGGFFVRGTEEFARPHEEEEPHDGKLEDVVIDGTFRRVLEVEVVAHGGEEDGADGVDSGRRTVGIIETFDEVSVDLM